MKKLVWLSSNGWIAEDYDEARERELRAVGILTKVVWK